ncbi:MAG: hypothetical protein H6Q89_1170 [Myxococcaceae bacterium]|nr:hypothetical protein [Myxococcaceae bacterium]
MISLALALWVSAAPGLKVSTKAPPVVVMVRTDSKGAFDRTQARLFEELTLLLDNFMLMSTPVAERDFPRRTLAEQIALVMPVAKANEAVAIVWLAEPAPGQLMLHLVALGTGRTLVRSIDFDRKSQSEAALALMLRELLGTAFLYSANPIPEVRQVLGQLKQAYPLAFNPPAPPAPPVEAEVKVRPPKSDLTFGATATVEAGLADTRGPSSRLGVALSGIWREWAGAELSFSVQRARLSQTLFTSTSLPLVAFGTWRFKTGDFSVGPRLGVGFSLDWVYTTLATPRFMFQASPIGTLGVEASQGLGPIRLLVVAEALGRVNRAEVIDTFDGAAVWRLPMVSARVGIGIRWEGFWPLEK